MVAKSFGEKLQHRYPAEPEQTEPRLLTVERDVPQDAFYMAWKMPKRTDKNYYACDLLSDILSNGNSSRLFQQLVKEKQLLSEVNAYLSGDLDEGMFLVTGKLYPQVSFEEAETAVMEELTKLTKEIIPKEELQKVKNKAEAILVFSEISLPGKAMALCFYEMLGEADLLNHENERYLSVQADDIRQTAISIFNPLKKNVLYYKAKKIL